MEEHERNLIRTNMEELFPIIADNIRLLTKDLWKRQLLRHEEVDEILDGSETDNGRTQALLDKLLDQRRRRRAFEMFYSSCKTCKLWAAADILKPGFAPHGDGTPQQNGATRGPHGAQQQMTYEEDSEEERIPDIWPSEHPPDLLRLHVTTVKDFDERRKQKYERIYHKSLTRTGRENIYVMKNVKRGLVFVINNIRFHCKETRDGSQKDQIGIVHVFHALGFDVLCVQNKTAREMWAEIKRISERDFSRYDCFILFLLTHGDEGVVYGTDGWTETIPAPGQDEAMMKKPHNCLKIKHITDCFCKVNSLLGKPKLFFVQACQGTKEDAGHPVGGGADSPMDTDEDDDDPILAEGGDQMNDEMLDYVSEEFSDGGEGPGPSRVDVFIAMATTPGYVSYRRADFGTWFIQAIIEVFAKYAYKFELNQLMRRVNALIVKAETVNQQKQVMEKKSTLCKDFFFFPGFHHVHCDREPT